MRFYSDIDKYIQRVDQEAPGFADMVQKELDKRINGVFETRLGAVRHLIGHLNNGASGRMANWVKNYDAQHPVWVYKANGKIVACGMFSTNQKKFRPTIGIFVDEAHRRRGIGTALASKLLSFAKEYYTEPVVVYTGNRDAVLMYRKAAEIEGLIMFNMGFKEPPWVFYIREYDENVTTPTFDPLKEAQ